MKKFFLLLFVFVVLLNGCMPPDKMQDHEPVITGTRSAASLNIYYGTLHNHSNYSDGTGTPENAYVYARDIAGLDFFGLADHDTSLTLAEWESVKSIADTYNEDGTFAAFAGFEWSHSTYGHVSVINTTDICRCSETATDTFTELCTWLSTREGVAFFNHPGRQDSTGVEFNHFTSEVTSKFVGIELWNKNDGFDVYYYNDGYYTGDGNKGFYDEALVRNWGIGAAGSDDNHNGTYSTENDYRLAIIADSLTRTNLYNAMKSLRFYSTGDKNLKLSFTLNNAQMGSSIAAGTYDAVISAYDTENFISIDLLENGAVLQTWTVSSSAPEVSVTVTTAEGDYYYARVKQTDGEEAISSPVFILGDATESPTIAPTADPTEAATSQPTAIPTNTPGPIVTPVSTATPAPTAVPTATPSA